MSEGWGGVCSGSPHEQRTGREVGHASAMVGVWLAHGGRVGISSDRWRATVGARWELILSWLQAVLDLGPKSKVEANLMIYKTH